MSTATATSRPSASWRRNLVAIWFAELIAIVGFTVVIPLLPLYVQELGVQGEREVRIWAGVIFSGHAVAMAIFGPIWGALSDRYGRKVMVERAMFSGSVVIGLMGLAQDVQQLTLLRILRTRSSPRPRRASAPARRWECSRWRSTSGPPQDRCWEGWWRTRSATGQPSG
jgi:MFS family permease